MTLMFSVDKLKCLSFNFRPTIFEFGSLLSIRCVLDHTVFTYYNRFFEIREHSCNSS